MDSHEVDQSVFCSRCGAKAGAESRFCGTCGTALALPETVEDGAGHEEAALDGQTEALSLGAAWAIWAGAAGVMTLLVTLQLFLIAFHVYLVLGFVMTRIVMRRLIEFHPAYNTLDVVFSAKVRMFFLWPLSMLNLLIRLSVSRAL